MSTSYHHLFRKMPAAKAPSRLSDAVMLRIEAYEVRRLRLRAAFHGFLVLAALVLCVPALNYLGSAVAQSGFSEYLSLAFSDGGFVLSHFKDFVLTLADSLPGTGVAAILAVGVVFLWSLRSMLVNLASLSNVRRTMRAA